VEASVGTKKEEETRNDPQKMAEGIPIHMKGEGRGHPFFYPEKQGTEGTRPRTSVSGRAAEGGRRLKERERGGGAFE